MNPAGPLPRARRRAADDDALLRPWRAAPVSGPRLLLALKAGLACVIAWNVAPLMPGVVAQYPYYAPLGALTVMYPTLMGSLRTGLQTLVGLGIGMALAMAIHFTSWATSLTMFLAIVLGVVLAGVRRFGAGADYIPMAALFVLIVGGPDAEGYSVGYLVQMATGVVIGLAVHWLIAQPVDIKSAGLQLDRAERLLVHYLRDVAREVRHPGSTSRRDWLEVNNQLASMTAQVRSAVVETADGMRANPRMLLPHNKAQDPGLTRLVRAEHVAYHMRDLTDVLRRLFSADGTHMVIPDAVSKELERALRSVAEVLRVAWKVEGESLHALTTSLTIVPLELTEDERDEVAILARRARARISDLSAQLEDLSIRSTWDQWWLVTVGTDLERILQVVTATGASLPAPRR